MLVLTLGGDERGWPGGNAGPSLGSKADGQGHTALLALALALAY